MLIYAENHPPAGLSIQSDGNSQQQQVRILQRQQFELGNRVQRLQFISNATGHHHEAAQRGLTESAETADNTLGPSGS